MKGNFELRQKLARWLIVLLVAATTLAGTMVFADFAGANGLGVVDVLLIALFAVLFLWVSFSFWLAVAGFVRLLTKAGHYRATLEENPPSPALQDHEQGPRTAVLIPVYNENPWEVSAGLLAMMEEVHARGYAEGFDFYILSDTNNPAVCLEEELAWGLVRRHAHAAPRVYYRRRANNIGKKSGNIADFCQRWGNRYEYMIVLDADSVMSADTLVEMVGRMDANDDAGILQVPPIPVNRGSLFARVQEFASSVYGKVFTAGFNVWSQDDGNYWGHNAIIRIQPFLRHCGLPELPGQAPLGGEILSHDFVEAAWMRRAGWKVILADDLGGSYEECPATLIEFAKRDQRWCQGNLQHLKILFAYGLHPISRMHLGMGIMSYLASSLWLLFMLLGLVAIALARFNGSSEMMAATVGAQALALFVITMAMLLAPKFLGYIVLLTDRQRLRRHRGPWRAMGGVFLEILVSVVVAPIMMAFHVTFVVMTLLGRKVEWSAQQRDEVQVTFTESFSAHAGHMIAGLLTLLVADIFFPSMLWWLSPIWFGLIVSVPVSVLLSSVETGQWLRKHGILTISEESAMPRVLVRQQYFRSQLGTIRQAQGRTDPFMRVIVDPAFHALHLSVLEALGETEHQADMDERLSRLERVAFYGGPNHLRRGERLELLNRVSAMSRLHESAWKEWPEDVLKRYLTVPAT